MSGDINTAGDSVKPPERESPHSSQRTAQEGSLTPNNLNTIHGLEQSKPVPSAFTSNEKLLGQLNPQKAGEPSTSTKDQPTSSDMVKPERVNIIDQAIAEGRLQTITPEEAARSIEAHQRFHDNQGQFLRDIDTVGAFQQYARENSGQSSITPDGAIKPEGATANIIDQAIAEGRLQTITPEEAARSIEAHQRFHENQGGFLGNVNVLAELPQITRDKAEEQTAAEQSRNNSRAREIKTNVAQDIINQRIENLDGPNSDKTKAVAHAILNGELDDAAAMIKKMDTESVAAMGTTLALAFRDSGISVSKASYAGKDRFEEGLIFNREGSTSALMLTTEEGRDPLIGNIVSKPGEKEKLKFDQNADRFDKDTLMGAIAVTAANNIANGAQGSLPDEKAALARQFSPNGAMADRDKDGQISAPELAAYRDATQDPIERRRLDAVIRNFYTVAGSDEKISREDAEARKAKIMEQGTLLAVADGLAGKPMSGLPDLLSGSLYSDEKATEFQNAINKKLSQTGARVEIGPSQIDDRQNESRRLNVIGPNNKILSTIDIPVRRTRPSRP